jgi:hypothetical protein
MLAYKHTSPYTASNTANIANFVTASSPDVSTARRTAPVRPSYLFLRNREHTAPIILDVESSGFGVGSYPIEIGLVLPKGQTFSYLIRPEPEWLHWDAEGEATHGISRTQIEQEGLPVRFVAQALNDLLRGEKVYSDGWGYDSTWLSLLYEHAKLPQLFQLECLTRLMTEKQFSIWDETKRQVIAEVELQRHRADNDAVILQKTFLRSFW